MRRQVLRQPAVQVITRMPANLLKKLEQSAGKQKKTKQVLIIEILSSHFGIDAEVPKIGRPAKKKTT